MNAEVVAALVGVVVGGSGLALSLVNAHDVRRHSRLDVFLTLHTRFLGIFEQLPTNYATSNWETWNNRQKQAGRLYWHNARAEFLATKGSGEKLLERLWHDYFAGAVSSGSETPALRSALGSVLMADEPIPADWESFLTELDHTVKGQQDLPVGGQ